MTKAVRTRWQGAWRAGLAATLALVSSAALAQLDEALVGENTVAVLAYKGDRVVAEGGGIVINDQGDVLTSAAVVDAGVRTSVVAPGGRELAAQRKWLGRNWDMAVLRVPGLTAPGLAISEAAMERGSTVFTATRDREADVAAFTRGAVGEFVTHALNRRDVRYVQHNAEHSVRGYGSPIVNECSEVVGLNVPDPKRISLFTAPHKVRPRDAMHALSVGELAARLRSEGIDFSSVTGACKSAAERAREEKEEADRQAAEAEKREAEAEKREAEAKKRLEEIEAQKAETEKAKEEERAKAERERRKAAAAEAEREAAEQRAAEARRLADEERTHSERMRQLVLWGGILGAAVLLLALLLWLFSSHRKRRALDSAQARAAWAEQEAAQARREAAAVPDPAPFDCVLAGEDGDGAPYALNLGRGALGDPAGVSIGRDPGRSSHVVADPSVSREHARMFVSHGRLHVEDLGSTNGTFLNGRRLEAGQGTEVVDGDELMLGSLTLRVELRR